jgi:hypothetical protein
MGWVVALLIGSAVPWMLARAGSDQGRRKAMTVSGFELPAAFVQLREAIQRGQAPTDWGLKENVDAYGRPWEVPDLRIYCDLEEIQSDTDLLSNMFLHEDRFQQIPAYYATLPGFIADFTGVANFVWFGRGSDGSPYCFDFGTNRKEPSVVHWDGYWRRVAPNFESFIALFVDIFQSPQWLEDDNDDEEEELTQLTGRILLRNKVPLYVVGLRAALEPSFFSELVRAYAEISPEERKAVEAEVREDLKSDEAGGMKMTDEKRWRLDELWERLRASLPS